MRTAISSSRLTFGRNISKPSTAPTRFVSRLTTTATNISKSPENPWPRPSAGNWYAWRNGTRDRRGHEEAQAIRRGGQGRRVALREAPSRGYVCEGRGLRHDGHEGACRTARP